MYTVSKSDREWAQWLKDQVEKHELKCFGGCGDRATIARATGKMTGAWCRGCFSELTKGAIPKLDPPKGIKRGKNRKSLMD